MRIHGKPGSTYTRVNLTAREVAAFMRRWPASGLKPRPAWFEFDPRGDLVDLKLAGEDGPAAVALCEDAKLFAFDGIAPEWQEEVAA